MTRIRLNVDTRREAIIAAAFSCAKAFGFLSFTRDDVAATAECSTGLVSRYFDMDTLRDEVMRRAVEEGDAEIVALGVAVRNPIAMKGAR